MKKIIKFKRKGSRKWGTDQLIEAVTLAGEIGYSRSSAETGIPFSTLRNYARRKGFITPQKNNTEMTKFREKVQKVAIEKAADYFCQRAIDLAATLFDTAEEAVEKTRNYIKGRKRPKKEDALWIKALVAVWLNAINSGQLLGNKPTSIEAKFTKNEHSFIIEKITKDPKLARDLQDVLSERVSDIN